ncbi:EamA family transporter [Clostridium sp. AN503]|uniref:DMT family transporter n=1 Tax=Clostridium sp. AN503 TaxID=3160598 RepID=UPI00345914D5
MENSVRNSKWMLVGSMLMFGTIGIFRRQIPLSSSVIALARAVLGTLFLLFLMAVKGSRPSVKAVTANLPALLVSGVLIGFNWILLFEAYQYTSVAVATLCYYTAPVLVILVSPVFLKEKLTGKKLVCVAAALAGMVLVSGVAGSDVTEGVGSSEWKGILLGLGAAALYAAIMILNKKIRDIPAIDKTVVQLAAAGVVLLPYTWFTEDISAIRLTPVVGLLLVIVGVVHTGIGYAMYFGSMKALRAQTVALFSYIDPVTAILLSALFLNERMGTAQMAGAVLILCAAVAGDMPEKVRR